MFPCCRGVPVGDGGQLRHLSRRGPGPGGAMSERLSGILERITFHNADTGFAVLRVQASGRRGLVTVVGTIASPVVGEYIEATGAWINDRDHGQQFKADDLRTTPPQTVEGIEKYLASGLIKGIGRHY